MSADNGRPRAVILDYGVVLSRPQRRSDVRKMARRLGVTRRVFIAAYWRHRPAYDNGLDVRTYWMRVLRTLGRLEHRDAIDWLIERDVSSWTDYRPEMWRLAARLRRAGRRIAMLSNAVPENVAKVRADWPLERYFDVVVLSYEVGCIKPDPEIFRITLRKLGARPEEALFVDDRAVNVAAAEKVGIRGFRFAGPRPIERLKRVLG